ncbi:Tetratricopeptide repeat-containing protein [Malonomonas rubra DSM 5091]|uniref:Tetratricopeptide repeat-containing protein n=1 Tax=Malonomonas rubra DSM 5091 TaxID=1122189 RepID=A0A1M6DLL5_MALRU|nr:tetratricopeptide repeat protein [Malonomonas rubra]SHI74092.1 Tetratricopeptide repeat-containing protein [Malonomonas rubra DSM 5091]
MAANKDKLIESAQKSLKKKQFARAIKDYLKVVDLDPADVRSRQKLAELLVKTNRGPEAYEHFEAVAKYFSTNGFYLKAIAIYKQMQRIDPSQVSLFSRLAELNEKQGLIGNAMAEYRNLISYYERNEMVADVIKVLEKMRDMDETNLNVRVKLAEVLATNDRGDEGLAEFEAVLETLSEKNDFDKILKLYKMFLPLFPNNEKLKMGLALTLFEKGELEKGVDILNGLLQEKPDNPDLLRLVARGYNDLKDWEHAAFAYKQLLDLDPTDLETRNLYIQVLLDSGQHQQSLEELEEWKDSFFKSDRVEMLKEHYEALKELLPEDRTVIQTLDSIYELTGDGDKLLDIIAAQDEDEEQGEVVLEETLSDSILASAEEDIDIPGLEIDLPLDDEANAEASDEEVVDELILDVPEEELDLDLDMMDDVELTTESEPEEQSDSVINLDLSESDELESLGDDDLELSFALGDEDEAAPAAVGGGRDLSTDLEELDFYIQQGLYKEAEKLCTDVMAYAPDSEECQQKLNIILGHLNEEEQEDSVVVPKVDLELSSEEEDDFFTALDDDAEKKVFRTDVDEQIAADDMESHYNLGIAYREMGLFDDAISEFGKAERDPSRFVDCQTLKGLCYADKGDYANAELMYQQALDSPHLEDEQRLSLSFELASLYETSERLEEALSSYRVVLAQDESYRNVKEKVAELQQSLGIASEPEPVASKERISFL